jgi:hypothetical protein
VLGVAVGLMLKSSDISDWYIFPWLGAAEAVASGVGAAFEVPDPDCGKAEDGIIRSCITRAAEIRRGKYIVNQSLRMSAQY